MRKSNFGGVIMDNSYDIVFVSEAENGEKNFQIASGFISETKILFQNENVVAVIQAQGSVKFYNMKEELLDEAKVQMEKSGREVYEDICCFVDGKNIVLKFPVYRWIDNYPHCDGEYDRWDTKTIGYNTVTFDTSTAKVI